MQIQTMLMSGALQGKSVVRKARKQLAACRTEKAGRKRPEKTEGEEEVEGQGKEKEKALLDIVQRFRLRLRIRFVE